MRRTDLRQRLPVPGLPLADVTAGLSLRPAEPVRGPPADAGTTELRHPKAMEWSTSKRRGKAAVEPKGRVWGNEGGGIQNTRRIGKDIERIISK